ncbi:coiled-coil domain-containing protein 87 [Echinops telfairi]|uniref:Coiled-coil domain-containing protein 87 n=1 Tax=Echinops telfairi TaxID=9371 RepID=A0ABM1VM01_ECHTE|nr:coiled-coil domain-containing protein 87 [Echinops telfairi]
MDSQERTSDLQRFYHQLLQPLSLFPRKATPGESQKPDSQIVYWLQALPRTQPTAASLCRQVAERLASSGLTAPVPPENRLRLIEVILEELRCSWQAPPAEPSLSRQNNQKLWERLEAHVLLSSEQLFLRYLHLLVTLTGPAGVFTEGATLTRLAASLARDCSRFLTSPAVYHCLLADFQALLRVDRAGGRGELKEPRCLRPMQAFKLCPLPWPHSTGFAKVPCSNLNLNYLIHLSRPSEYLLGPGVDPVKELKAIPQLSKTKSRWLASQPKKKDVVLAAPQKEAQPSSTVSPPSQASPTTRFPVYTQLRRWHSMPSLRQGWKLADELGLLPHPPRTLTPLVLVAESRPELAGDVVAEDLKEKMKKLKLKWPHYLALDTDLPPLLGALTHHPTAGHRLRELQKKLKALEEEEALHQQALQPPKAPPLHPQPVTVTLRLRNQLVVQVAAVRVSCRNLIDSFHVEGAGVLYNHLAGELDRKLIEDMDRDRSVGSSSQEIYKELGSRVSRDYLRFDQGPLIEPAADKDWSAFLSSGFVQQDQSYHIINRELSNVYNQPDNLSQAYRDKMPSLTVPQVNQLGTWRYSTSKSPRKSWVRNSLSGEEYFKFLATQETDFLHAIFHLSEEELPYAELMAPVRESLPLQPPPPLLEEEEPLDFVPGEWDCNTVLQHGLGTVALDLLGRYCQIPSLQKRLEKLWSVLEVPHRDRLDMAIKYSSSARLKQLPALLCAWEQALQPIQLREALLGKLEWFERQASNPNRFFQKHNMNPKGLLEENQIRSYLQSKLNQVEASLVTLLGQIEFIFEEPVTFKGRRYLDKMKRDKVEMLYWLQQHRRIRLLPRVPRTSHFQVSQSGRHSNQHLIVPGNTPITL